MCTANTPPPPPVLYMHILHQIALSWIKPYPTMKPTSQSWLRCSIWNLLCLAYMSASCNSHRTFCNNVNLNIKFIIYFFCFFSLAKKRC